MNRHAALLGAEFTSDGVQITAFDWSWRLGLNGYGSGEQLAPVSDAMLSAAGNRVEYAYNNGITECYVNGPLGFQQGFTIERRPGSETGEQLEVMLRLSGDVVADVGAGGAAATLR